MKQQENKKHIIKSIEKGSIAESLSLEPGDELLRVNHKKLADVFDYHYLMNDEKITLLVRKKNGEEWELEIEKDAQMDIGVEFLEGLMDQYRSCRNKCIFCFIDQMPPGMRDTLYFKDDDARLSFLQGNYITLTNMSDEDVNRICFYKLSPINISIHTMNPSLREQMLHNRFAGSSLTKLDRFYEAGIEMNGQIVLCKGYNDKEELNHTILSLTQYLPQMKSVSVVPVGLTKYRTTLTPLEKFGRLESLQVIEQIEGLQKKIKRSHGTRFVYASDEWYVVAGKEVPKEEEYEGYPQIENGVGMVRSLQEEVRYALRGLHGNNNKKQLTIATGVLAAPILRQLIVLIQKQYPKIDARVIAVKNSFFGEEITVAGLLTGQDIIEQLTGKELGDYLILPSVLLKNGERVLLDDVTVEDIEKALQTTIRIVELDGLSFVRAIIE